MILDQPIREKVRITDIYEDRILTRTQRNEYGDWERNQVQMRYRRPVQKQSTTRRFISLGIDSFAIFVFENVTGYFFPFISANDFFSFLILFGYFFGFELFYQRTLGKLATGSIVVDEYGEPPGLRTIAIRTLIRFVPFEPFSFLGSDRGWHDAWSHTYVLSLEEVETIQNLTTDPKNLMSEVPPG